MDLLRCFFLLVFIILTCRNYKCNSLADQAVCDPPCQNGGSCEGGNICVCPTNFEGFRCQYKAFEAVCDPPCQNGGSCEGGNICVCPTNFEGFRCQYKAFEAVCNPPCQNGGSCEGGNICVCPTNFEGFRCQYKAFEAVCNPPCQNGGSCEGGNICVCPANFEGFRCQYDVCKMPPEPRNAKVECFLNDGSPERYSCTANCEMGFKFPHNEEMLQYSCDFTTNKWTPVDKFPDCEAECNPPCQNGGSCTAGNQCICKPVFEGNRCENVVCNPPCQNGGSCVGGNICECSLNFEGYRCQYDACKVPPEPRNAKVECFLNDKNPDRYSCKAKCEMGFKFPHNEEMLQHNCDFTTNKWTPEDKFPDCEAECNPPCQNGGSCTAGNQCICAPDFEGNRCENDLCKMPPEPRNAKVECFLNDTNSDRYSCTANCEMGYKFPHGQEILQHNCDFTTNEWTPEYKFPDCEAVCNPPCQNRGSCAAGNKCICTPDFKGDRCENDECKYPPEPRNSRMICSQFVLDKQSYACLAECDYGYKFPNGDTRATLTCNTTIKTWNPEDKFPDCEGECDPPCQNGGTCKMGNKCICNSNFEGDMCENVACYPPCRNGGICTAGNACICTPGFEGDRCENDGSCPAGMVYDYTSPCPKTCENYKTYREEDCLVMPQNTCTCPEDEVLKLGKCVNTSACEVCDEEGHVVGDVWQVEPCQICECRSDLTTKCIEQLCPEPPICEEQETILKVKGLNDTCCDSFQCVPKPGDGDCEEPKLEACPTGKALIMKQFGNCPVYQCECIPWRCPPIVTPHLDDGESFRLVTTDCCPEVEITCNHELCAPSPNCSEGFKLSTEKGRCCFKGKCVPQDNVCVYEHHYEVVNGTHLTLPPERYYDKEYQPGKLWYDGLCRECTCIDIKGRLMSQCELEKCQILGDFPDSEKYIRTEFRVPGYCCPVYVRELCVDEGVNYTIGDEWSSRENNFCMTISRCVPDSTGEAVLEVTSQCERPCIR